jgi:uncharacterized protein (DUF4213/DUF364 family)
MTLVDRLLSGLVCDGTVADVRIGLHWTAVVVDVYSGGRSAALGADTRAARGVSAKPPSGTADGNARSDDREASLWDFSRLAQPEAEATEVATTNTGSFRAGLAATQSVQDLEHGRPAVREAGRLIGKTGREMAALAASDSLTERSIGFAAINALLGVDELACVDRNAEDLILERAAGRKVAIVGHFPFVPKAREVAEACWVLELDPGAGDLPAESAPEIIPQADVVAITGMTLINGTFETLAALPRPGAYVVVLGPSTPLSPLLFDYGVDAISGAVITDISAALAAVSQGANFRQIPGKRLLTMGRDVEAPVRPL